MVENKSMRPWHTWTVAIAGLLWYLSGAITIFMAQAGSLPNLSPDEAAYYAGQSVWFILLTDISLVSAIMGSSILLFKPRVAFIFFSVSLTTIIITNTYDLLAGTSRALANTGALVATCIIVAIAIFMVLYSRQLCRSPTD